MAKIMFVGSKSAKQLPFNNKDSEVKQRGSDQSCSLDGLLEEEEIESSKSRRKRLLTRVFSKLPSFKHGSDSIRSTITVRTSDISIECSDRLPGGRLKLSTQKESLGSYYGKTLHCHSVQWGDIEIRSHEISLGDNPSCHAGPPLTTKWEAFDTISLKIDDYETTRPFRRSKHQLVMPGSVREDILREAGYARGEIRDAVLEVDRIHTSRSKNSRPGPRERYTHLVIRLEKKKSQWTNQKAKLSDSIRDVRNTADS
jgi:hypothetical protein